MKVKKLRSPAARVTVVVALVAVALVLWPEQEFERTLGRDDRQKHSQAVTSQAVAEEVFTCGMHPHVLAEKNGHCPICGMQLVPAKTEPARTIKYWRAPMDPDYVSDRPGKSPMGMDLVPVYADGGASRDPSDMTISPIVVQNMGVRTAMVKREPLKRTVRTVGTIEYDEQLVRDVTTKFHGWIEELYAHYTGQRVDKGMPLFRVFSRELYSTQEEYLLALRNKDRIDGDVMPAAEADMRQLVESSRLRLKLFDIGDDQIADLEKRGVPSKTLTIVSPYAGVIVEKGARDGMHVNPGTKLYTIADLSRVWVSVDIYENEVPFVKIGQPASMNLSHLPSREFTGTVVYVYPFVDESTRTVKVRMEFDNPHLELKPGMFADIEIAADIGRRAFVVPRAAVIDTGERQIAFVSLGEGRFAPRVVRVGLDAGDDQVEIVDGLAHGELVVTSGQFLLDSESKLREAVEKMGEASHTLTRPQGVERESGVASSRAGGEEKPANGAMRIVLAAPALAPDARAVLLAYMALQSALAEDAQSGLDVNVADLEGPLTALISAAATEKTPGETAVRRYAVDAYDAVRQMSGRSVDAIRAHFIDLSTRMIEIVKIVGSDNLDLEFYAFHCPMAGAGWIQAGGEAANPYYGFAMPRCGDPMDIAPLAR